MVGREKVSIFATQNKKIKMHMEAQTFHFSHPVGTFKESVRAYRKYKKEWRAKMEVKLAKMEEEIRLAKADPFHNVEAV